MRYDRDGDQHYDVISAFIKSLRGSDVQAGLHYLARMMEAGEDPRFIARRLIILASEDIGMAAPSVLQTCVAAAQAVALIGMPEARINLAQAVIACAMAPKSNAVVKAVDAAIADVRAGLIGTVPPAPARRPLPGREAARPRRRATSTPTTPRTGSPASSTCRTSWPEPATTSPPSTATRRQWPNGYGCWRSCWAAASTRPTE